jgi:hypothetical protein
VADLQLVIVAGPDAGREFDLTGGIVVGRDPSSGIVIEDADASERHASFAVEGASVTVEDLGSANGTFVNGERLAGSRMIGEGDRVRIGTTVFEIRSLVRAGGTEIPGGPPSEEQPPQPLPQEPGGYAQPGAPPAAYGQGAMTAAAYPVGYEVGLPEGGIARWRPFLQGTLFPVLAIPHYVVLFFIWIAAFFAWVAAFFAILFTGRYPRGLFDFLAGTLRWTFRVMGFTYLFTEAYPPFSLGEEPDYPIRVRVAYPEGGIARWRPLVHWLLAIPHYIVLYFLGIGAFFAYLVVWFAVVFTRAYPPALFNFLVGYHRWQVRYAAYFAWMTEEYPPFSLSETPGVAP